MVVQIWYAPGVKGGSDTVTVAQTNADSFGFYLLSYQGIQPLMADGANIRRASGDAGATMQAGPLTTNGPRDLIVAVFASTRNLVGRMGAGPAFDPVGDDQEFIPAPDSPPLP